MVQKTGFCLNEDTYKSKLNGTSVTSEIINKCTNLGFKKGTEGLKNCVLELSK